MKIEHISVFCFSLDDVLNFFVKYFNAEAGTVYENGRSGLNSCFLTFPDGETRLELVSRIDSMPYNNPVHRSSLHLSFSLGDRAAVIALTYKLKTDGFKVLSAPRLSGEGSYESCILGPENMQIELGV